MQKRVIFFIVVIIVLLLTFVNISLVNSNSIKIDSEVNKEVKDKGEVSILVKMKDVNSAIDSSIDEDSKRYSTFNGASLEVDERELNKLMKDNRIESIELNEANELFLQQAVPLINASVSWRLKINGVNITGKDESVCVIDTGVNSTHTNLLGKIIGQHCFCSDNPYRDGDCCPNGLAEDTNAEDFDGHGTHVSGIIAANGSIEGVAPDTKIVAMRVFGEEDILAYDNDIISAIDYCVNNSALYNISVISMSLGGGAYTGYCDAEETSFAASINAAVAKNISVIVASGNNGNYTAIAAPACIENATSVGDSYDANVGGIIWTGKCTDSSTYADKIVCHANRNSALDLLAPGALINSTWKDGGYSVQGGTSMATPMVAGAFALIRQFYTLSFNKTLSPKDIQNALNNTGKRIDDTNNSGLNFSRIDIYSAIESLDNSPPYVAFISPLNRTYSPYSIVVNITNGSDAVYVWWNNGTANISYTEIVTLINLSNGSYTFIAYANDSFGNLNSTSVDFSVALPSLNLSLVSPTSANISYGRFFNISVNASCFSADCGDVNVSASINNSGTIELINTTIGALPFYTNESNPRTINLNQNESEIVIFYVNTTGSVGYNYSFYINANVSFNVSISSEAAVNLSIQQFSCAESWSCSSWSACSSSLQTRSCTDANSCGTINSKPALSQACDSGDDGDGGGGGGGSPPKIANNTNSTQNKTTSINNVSANISISAIEKNDGNQTSTNNNSNILDSKTYIAYVIAIIAIIIASLIIKLRAKRKKWITKGKRKKS